MQNIRIYAFADEASSSIDKQIAAMKRNGLNGLEIRNVDGTNISEITCDKAREVRKKLDDAGLTVWSIGSPIGKIDIERGDFGAHLDVCKHTVELASILGAENLRMFSFYIPTGKNPDDYKNEVIERLGHFTDIARGSGVDLCHENEKGIYGDIATRCAEVLKALPELKGVFDPANFIQCGQNTLEAWEMLKNRIKYFHVKDAFYDGSVVPAGKGEGNLKEIVSDYIKSGGIDFTIEPHLSVFDGFADLEKSENESLLANRYVFKTNDEAFDAACEAFKSLI